jgi:hypothetical protein
MTERPKTPFSFISREKRSWLLLISILLFFTLAPLLEGHKIGGLLLLLLLYVTLVAATSELAEKRHLYWSAIPIAISSMILLLASHYYSAWVLVFASDLVLTSFLMLVSVSLFIYLGQRGPITRDRLLVSVSLYFLLGLSWFALYNLVSTVEPGSFAEQGKALTGEAHWSSMLYFSLVTLTTLGYGDITAIKPFARMIATLEAAAGVLYIAITVARLVAAQGSPKEREP